LNTKVIGLFKLIEDISVENKNRQYRLSAAQGLKQTRIIKKTKIPAEPKNINLRLVRHVCLTNPRPFG